MFVSEDACSDTNTAVCIFQGLKKPYNPILGETFRCCWLHPQTNSCTFYIAEQVKPGSLLETVNAQDMIHPLCEMFCTFQQKEHTPVKCSKCKITALSLSLCCSNVSLCLSSARCPTIHPSRPFMSAIGRMVFLSVGASWPSPSSMVDRILQHICLS